MKEIMQLSLIALMLLVMSLVMISCESKDEVNEETQVETNEETQVEAVELAYEDKSYLVDAKYLSENLSNEDVLILDVRGDDAYAKGHIPGAVSVSWPQFANVTGAPGDEGWGVVLDAEALSEKLASVGVDQSKTVIVYADTKNGWGEDGRIVWMLRMAGIENSKILDGGINFWQANDYEVTKEETLAVASDFKVEELNTTCTINTEELNSRLEEVVILDTREQNEYDGDAKFGEKRGGHLPNARLLTFNEVLNEDGTFKNANELNAIFKEVGLNKEEEIITYCTAGIRSAHLQIALSMMGYENVRNYDASFYEYAAKEELNLESKVIVKGDFKYYSAEQLKTSIERELPINILDIQVEDEYNLHSIKGSVATYAFPVKSDEEKAKIEQVLPSLEETNNRIVIVCPRGGGGAERTAKLLLEKGVDNDRIFILEDGQAGWTFEDLLN